MHRHISYKFFGEYIKKLDEYYEHTPYILAGPMSQERRKQVELLEKDITINFDHFIKILRIVEVEDFPEDTAKLLGKEMWKHDVGFNPVFYLSSSAFKQLKLNKQRFERKLLLNLLKKFSPIYWIKISLTFILRIPYNIINTMGFDHEQFINTFWGKLIALAFFIAFLLFLGFTTDQLGDFIKSFFN